MQKLRQIKLQSQQRLQEQKVENTFKKNNFRFTNKKLNDLIIFIMNRV